MHADAWRQAIFEQLRGEELNQIFREGVIVIGPGLEAISEIGPRLTHATAHRYIVDDHVDAVTGHVETRYIANQVCDAVDALAGNRAGVLHALHHLACTFPSALGVREVLPGAIGRFCFRSIDHINSRWGWSPDIYIS